MVKCGRCEKDTEYKWDDSRFCKPICDACLAHAFMSGVPKGCFSRIFVKPEQAAQNAYISIGNSDNKLTQAEWAAFISETNSVLQHHTKVHGVWYSAPNSEWQNANWCVELNSKWPEGFLRSWLKQLAKQYRQDSIALAFATPEFVKP